MLRYTVLLRKNEDGPGYGVMVPELPGCFTQGDDLDEALTHAKDAIEGYLETIVDAGEEIPLEPEPFIVASIAVDVLEYQAQGGRQTIIRGHTISSSKIRTAISEGAQEGRIPDLGGKREYYIEVDKIAAPIRWVITEATGMGTSDFNSTDAQRALKKLGFIVKKLDSRS